MYLRLIVFLIAIFAVVVPEASLAVTDATVPAKRYVPGQLLLKLSPQAAIPTPPVGMRLSPPPVPGTTPAVPPAAAPALLAVGQHYEATYRPLYPARPRAHRRVQRSVPDLSGLYLVTLHKIDPEADLEAVAREFAAQPGVLYAEPNYLFTVLETIPNDPFFASSGTWGQPYADLWGLHRINAARAWDTTQGANDVVVAVVDTGLARLHPDLGLNVYVNSGEIPGNRLDDDHNGYVDDLYGWDFVEQDNDPQDDNGHGTHVAGTIAAVGNNRVGVVGVTWRCRIMACRGLNAAGNGTTSDLVQAIVYAADNGADVINNSWGNGQATTAPQALVDAVNYAAALGCVVVAAAGNQSADVGTPAKGFFPACIEPAICVSAFDATGDLASFSNYGQRVNVGAPGVDVLSCLAAGSMFATDPAYASRIVAGEYLRISGTSMAAPHVAGAAALLRSLAPGLDPVKVRGLIELAADDVSVPGRDVQSGWGMLNAAQLVALAPHPHVSITSPTFGTGVPALLPLPIVGTVTGEGLLEYEIDAFTAEDWPSRANPIAVAGSTAPVENATLAVWQTLPAAEQEYVLRLRAFYSGNGTAQDVVRIRIDNSMIIAPTAGATVRGTVSVRGTAAGAGFVSYALAWRPDGGSWNTLLTTTTPVVHGVLGVWNPVGRRDGVYELRLTVNYAGGQSTTDTVQVLLDGLRNEITHPPFAATTQGQVAVQGSASSINSGFTRRLSHFSGGDDYAFSNQVYGYTPTNETLLYQGSQQVTEGLLANWDSAQSPSGWGLLVQKVDDAVNDPQELAQWVFNHNQPALHDGWPIVSGPYPFAGALTAIDTDGDGEKELVGTVVTYFQRDFWAGAFYKVSVFVWELDGTVAAGWAGGRQTGFGPGASTATCGELDGDPLPEIVCADNDRVYAWNGDGTPVAGWAGGRALTSINQQTPRYGSACPVLADLDGDGLDEIIVDTDKTFVLRANGSHFPGWPKETLRTSGNLRTMTIPAVGELDGDPQPEIVVALQFSPTMLYAYNHNGTPLSASWPLNVAQTYNGDLSGPVIADIDRDGYGEILLTAGPRFLRITRDTTVTLVDAWDYYYGSAPGAGIVVANLDADPELEMVVPSTGFNFYFYMSRMAVYDQDNTRRWAKLWRASSAFDLAAVATDLTGDTVPEILCPFGDRLYAWDTNGNELVGWPIGALSTLHTAPLVDDLDGDGLLEVAYAGYDGLLSVWDVPAAYDWNHVEWSQLRGNAGHTGAYAPPRYGPTPTPTPRHWFGISVK